MVKKIATDFEAKSVAMAGELAGHIVADDYRAMAKMMTGNTVLILLKSRKVIRGSRAIVSYWKNMRAAGLVGIRINVEEHVLMPIDVKMSEPAPDRKYVTYDLANYLFGTCQLEFEAMPSAESAIIFQPLHKQGCPRLLMSMVFTNL
jgi:hypothetical protein